MISCNSIRNSNFRGIVIDGVSDITLSKNVVHECYGHAYVLGGQHLQVLDNFASDVRRVLPPVSGTSDHDVKAFFCPYQYNTLVGNKAIGSEFYGFLVENNEYTPPTVLVSVISYVYFVFFLDEVSHSHLLLLFLTLFFV